MSVALDRLAELLERAGKKVIRRGGKLEFSCPLHDDRTPSAGAEAGSRVPVVAFCQPCGEAASLPAMLKALDASDDDRNQILGVKPRRHENNSGDVLYHVYHDARGVPELRVGRRLDTAGKTTLKPDGTKDIWRQLYHGGSWCWPKDVPENQKPDTRHLLYNLPAVLQAVQRGDTIHIGEGERVCDALIELGFVATCNLSGASKEDKAPKWKLPHAEHLRGAGRAISWQDHDATGAAHTGAVCRSLVAVEIPDVRVVNFPELPEHGDLVDWLVLRKGKGLTRGQVRAELEQLIETAPRWAPRVEAELKPSNLPENGRVVLPLVLRRTPFPSHALPDSCRRLVEEGARARGVDLAYVGVPMLAALAGAIGNAVRLRVKRSYLELAVLWMVLVAPSGTMKSPQLDLVFRPHRERDRKLFEKTKEELADYRSDLARYQAARKGGESAERPERPRIQALLVSDPTVEALVRRLEDNPRGLTLVRDELSGLLGGFDAYKRSRGSDVTFFLEAYRGGEVKVDRKSEDQPTIHVRCASVSIAGTTQPGVLTRAIGQQGRENGLLARMFVAMPPPAYPKWNENDISDATFTDYDRTVGTLLELTLPESGEPAELSLSGEARELWRDYHDRMTARTETAADDLRAAFSKLKGGALRFALVVALARAAEECRAGTLREVDARAMAAGVELAEWFADEAERVYEALKATPEQAHTRRQIEWIEAHGGRVAPHDLVSSGPRPRFTTSEEAEKFLRGLVGRGHGAMEDRLAGPRGGRPGIEFVLNGGGGSETPALAGNPEGFSSTSTNGHGEITDPAVEPNGAEPAPRADLEVMTAFLQSTP